MLATINILAGLPRGTGWIVSKISLKYCATTLLFMQFKRIVKIVALRSMDIPKKDKYFCKFETTWYNNLASLFKEIIINLSPRKSNKSFANPFQLERTSKTTLRTPTRSTCKYLPEEVTRGVNSKRIRKYPFSSILSSLHVTLLSFSLSSLTFCNVRAMNSLWNQVVSTTFAADVVVEIVRGSRVRAG